MSGALLTFTVFGFCLASADARAGEGRLVPGDNGPTTGSMTVHIAYPPTQANVDLIADKLRHASRMFCDATDGAIQLNEFALERNGFSAARADILWQPPSLFTRFTVTGSGPFGHPSRHLHATDNIQFRVIAHEFGHLVTGLRDQYDEQRRFGSGCGIGVAIDEADWDEANHSIMQRYDAKCVDDSNPLMLEPQMGGPTNCQLAGKQKNSCDTPTYRCYEFTAEASELNTPLVFDRTRGDGLGYQGPRSGTSLLLDVWLGQDVEPDVWVEANRTIEYIDSQGTSHEVTFEAYHRPPTNAWDLRASIEGTDLTWEVNYAPTTPALTLTFGATPGCGNSMGNYTPGQTSANYWVEAVNGEDVFVVDLIIPGYAIGQQEDVRIDVSTTDLCERRTANSVVDVRPNTFDWQFDGLGRGAYFGALGPGAPLTTAVYQQLGICSAKDVDERWNRSTQRWETSDQYRYVQALIAQQGFVDGDLEYEILQGTPSEVGGSDWELMEYNLAHGWPNKYPWFAPVDLSWLSPVNHDNKSKSATPTVDNRAACSSYPIEVNTDKISAEDTIAILLDRSGSMGNKWKVGGKTQRRIDWARAGVAGFADAAVDEGIDVVVMEFAEQHDILIPLSTVETGQPIGTPGVVRPWEIIEAVKGIDPLGMTAIHDAVDAVFQTLPVGANSAVFMLTDGEDNSSTISMEEVSDTSKALDIPIYISPIGDFNGSTLQDLASQSGGELFAQIPPDEIPATFFWMRAKMRGEQLSLDARSVLSDGDPKLPGTVSYDINVEPSAERMVLLLTPDRHSQPTWDLDFTLTGPNDELIQPSDGSFVTDDPDGYYFLLRVPAPAPGTWTLELAAPVSETPKVVPEAQLALAHIEHDGPRCFASTSLNKITSQSDAVEIIAEAAWDGVIGDGVTFTASVRRPDGSAVAVPMVNGEDGLGYGSFDDYNMDGGYRVTVTCDVARTATYALGDGNDPNDHTLELVPAGFDRIVWSHFMFEDGLIPTQPRDHDCDDDGILNADESEVADGDGDGWPDICDSDSDGDDLPDRLDGAFEDTDGDGQIDKHDRDSDDDGEIDGADHDPDDPTAYRRYGVGDLNGDGLKDLVWGEPSHLMEGGRILVKYTGQAEPEEWTEDTVGIIGSLESHDQFGAAVVVGDFDGDGHDDVAVGVPGHDTATTTNSGAVHVIYGSPNGLTAVADQLWTSDSTDIKGGSENNDRFGARLAVGDFNCDGYADLVIGAPDEAIGSRVEAGAVHVLYGSSGGVSAVNDVWLQGDSGANGSCEVGARFGDTLVVGDFDNDACDDLVVGAPFEDWEGFTDAGNAYAIYGGQAGLDSGDWTVVRSNLQGTIDTSERLATRLWVEDRNDDGFDDLTTMSPGDPCGPGNKGFNYIYGGGSGLGPLNNVWTCRELNE
ncbi:FG-GAP repeat protein [Enhygromyxa salina]|uniref:FG-GAP repeat protein n=2 Tax=Enhygromyxa salina TaxID=215803 RepID=A0A2S9YDB2_9BACT|nr:FG-GAP repeat protein [Enhygromyxa salina]